MCKGLGSSFFHFQALDWEIRSQPRRQVSSSYVHCTGIERDYLCTSVFTFDRMGRASRLIAFLPAGRREPAWWGLTCRWHPIVSFVRFAIAFLVPRGPGVLLSVRALRGHPHHGSRLSQVYVSAFFSTRYGVLPGCLVCQCPWQACAPHMTGGWLVLWA